MFTPGFWRIKRFADTVPEMLYLQREMNRLFSDVGRSVPQDYPTINVWEKNDSVIVTAEVPGIDHEKIDVEVSGDLLTIAGAAQAEVFKDDEVYLRQERNSGGFKRNIKLPFQVNAQEVEAKYEKGILKVTLPRLKENLPQKIKINS
jgi:HSP20 family protein